MMELEVLLDLILNSIRILKKYSNCHNHAAWQDPNEMIGYSVQCRGCYNRTNIYDPVIAKQHVLKFD